MSEKSINSIIVSFGSIMLSILADQFLPSLEGCGKVIPLIIGALVGHGIIEFPCQTGVLAIGKRREGKKGILMCLIHSLHYSVIVLLWMGAVSPYYSLFNLSYVVFSLTMSTSLFLTHFIIDRWSLPRIIILLTNEAGKSERQAIFLDIVTLFTDQVLHLVLIVIFCLCYQNLI